VSRLSGEGLFNERPRLKPESGTFSFLGLLLHRWRPLKPYPAAFRRYNIPVQAPSPDPQSEPHPSGRKPAQSRIARLEATGVLIVAVLVLILTLFRYWHHIPWSAR
jgi:hypothetical protein